MSDSLWYKEAIIYQVYVRAFYDSNGDGIGDFRGLTEKLGYLQDLGVTTLLLMPFYPSPLKDDGYDIADYVDIHPALGTLDDFRDFLAEAHRRNLRVIVETVFNHTSDQHPWFQRARQAPPGSSERDFYLWSAAPEGLEECRVAYRDAETTNWGWDPVAGAYYWHRFFAHQPDLNFDNPAVRAAIVAVADFWFETGVDGLALAAIPFLFTREGSTCENLPEVHAFLRTLRTHVDARYRDRVLLAEANEWPEEAAAYIDQGSECQMAVNFAVAPRLFMAVRMEDRFPVVDIQEQTPPAFEDCQWALLLRNQDELSLEMVTDEERDYMYRVYARERQARVHRGIRRRLAPLLGNDRRQIELLNGLLFSLNGCPIIYYGDEIGMGDNIYLGDRNGVRTPMQWNMDRNAGFSRANPQRLYLPVIIHPEYHYEAVNAESEQANPASLWWWMKRLIALRRNFPALGSGSLEFLPSNNRKILSFIRRCPACVEKGSAESILVVANLSRYAEYVTLDLAEFRGRTPVEVVGQTAFPVIGEEPYLITLGPHEFLWFALQPERGEERPAEGAGEADRAQPAGLPTLRVAGTWEEILSDPGKASLEAVLPAYLKARRWFRGKARPIKGVQILDTIPVPLGQGTTGASGNDARENGATSVARVVPVRVEYVEGEPEIYVLPMAYAGPERSGQILDRRPHAAIARLGNGQSGLLFDAMFEPSFAQALLETITTRQQLEGTAAAIVPERTNAFDRLRGTLDRPLPAKVGGAEQSNTSIVLGDRLIMKLFRRIEEGVNPDLEITRFLTERTDFAYIAPVAGALTYRSNAATVSPIPDSGTENAGLATLGIVQGFVSNEGDAWDFTLDSLGRYLEATKAQPDSPPESTISTHTLLDLTGTQPPDLASDLIGGYLDAAGLLGRRTAQMHTALASDSADPAFAPEPFTRLYQRSLYQSMRGLADPVFDLLGRRLAELPAIAQIGARELLSLKGELLRHFQALTSHPVKTVRIRTHGDYHLGQVLFTGKDFVIIDFEGEPGRPLSERRFKRGALRDVAGMLRSFQYAAYGKALFGEDRGGDGDASPQRAAALDAWARYWQQWTCSAFLKSYLDEAGRASFLPQDRQGLQVLLDAYVLEKAVYELGYELNNRPGWVTIPIRSLLQLLRGGWLS